MSSGRATNSNSNDNSNNNNTHKRQWSESIISTDNSARLQKDDDRQLIHNLVNEYLLEGSIDILDLIRNCPHEFFEALVDFIWSSTSQTGETTDDNQLISNQRSSLLSSSPTNLNRKGARRRFTIILIEVFKLLSTPTVNGGRYDVQRLNRLISFPYQAGQLVYYEPDINGLSCLALCSIILINPGIVHQHVSFLIDTLKYAANHFAATSLTFDIPSAFAVSIYSLFYLLYLLYPNNLRRELQIDPAQTNNHNDKPINRLSIERVLLPLCYYFKLQPSIVCGSSETEKHENRWQNESWQQIIANGDRYVVCDDILPASSGDLRRYKEDESRKFGDSKRFEIGQVIRMCNEYTESVLHPSEAKSQIVKNTIEKNYGKKQSADSGSNYSDSYCQMYERQWQTIIQNGQIDLSRVQNIDDPTRRQSSSFTNGTSTKKDMNGSVQNDHNIRAKVELQLDMLDCNYEQNKREYYAQLVRDCKKTSPVNELEKALKCQEIQYQEMIDAYEKKRPLIHERRKRIGEFHLMNKAFYDSLSATQVELRTYEDDHSQQKSSFVDKQAKLQEDLEELEKAKASIENEIREIQRRSFETKQEAKQSTELRNTIDKLFVDLVCARKKHQLLHNALLNIKFKHTNAGNLFDIHQNDEDDNEDTLTLDEKKKKFDECKELLKKQQTELVTKRNNFNQLRNMNTYKISTIRRQIDSIRISQAKLNTMKITSQIAPSKQ